MSRRLHSAPSLPGVVLAVLATAAIVAAVLLSLGRQLEQVSTDPAIAASEGNGDTVRISAVKSDDGSVTVALQERSGGEWGERQLPRFRVLPADAPTGAWLNSSELTTSGAGAADDTLYCVISHGEPGDQFWRLLRGYVRQAELDLGINVRFFSSLQGSDQAATIEQCSADGAAVIAATLANPVAITDSLLAAKAAGARIITFNSGSEHAEAAGAEIHISLDDVGAGSLAAETFSQRGVTGTIACLIHEAANVGLESRCDGLEDAYAGDQVIRLRLPDDLEPSEVTDWIAQRLTDPDGPAIHAVLTLNADTQLQALDAIFQTADQLDYDVQNANIGGNSAVARLSVEQRNRHLLFSINNMVEAQGYLVTAALVMVNGFHQPAKFILNPLVIKGTPFVYNSAGLRTDAEGLALAFRNMEALLELSDAPEDD